VVTLWVIAPASITWLKGHHLLFFAGWFAGGLVWIIMVFRLARPESWWAQRYYSPQKMRRALRRYPAGH